MTDPVHYRYVARQKYGYEGPYSCHWCGRDADWHNLVVDHVNGDRGDPSPDNLVLACPRCNLLRGRIAKHLSFMTGNQRVAFLQAILDQAHRRSEWEIRVPIIVRPADDPLVHRRTQERFMAE